VPIEWLNENLVRTFHQELLKEHGGLPGPGPGSVEATLAHPHNVLAYGDPDATVPKLAAAYGYGFARNHCFADGNKRTALVSMDVFLQLNGFELTAAEPEVVEVIRAVAAGTMSEPELEVWMASHIAPI
jgi:death on curing protein